MNSFIKDFHISPTCLWLQVSHRESLHTSHHCPGQLPSDTAPSSSIMASSTKSTEKILPAASQMLLWRLLLLSRQMMDRPLSNSSEESFSGFIFWWLKWSLNCQSNWQGTGRLMGSLGEGSAECPLAAASDQTNYPSLRPRKHGRRW